MRILFYILTFFFILFSTFLTRSGILGETSVHAFTEMGLEWQLIAFMGFFLLLGIIMLFAKNKEIPSIKKEEAVSSREFWMFIGTLVLLFSSILISGIAQYLRYREVRFQRWSKKFWKHFGIAMVATLAITFLFTLWIDANAWQYKLMLAAGVFTVVANLDHLITFTKTNLKMAGATISHLGFGVMLIGILASSLNKVQLSTNPFAMRGLLSDRELLEKNVLLVIGDVMPMSGYEVTYVRDTVESFTRTFEMIAFKSNYSKN